jgi:hypothetical protein
MRLAFLHFGGVSPDLAEVMVTSVREHMPHATIVQLTDTSSDALEFVDEVRRLKDQPYVDLLMEHMKTLPEPYIRIDYDMVLQGDLSHILDGEQDFAVNLHGDPFMQAHVFGKTFPYAACVFGANSRSTDFAHDLQTHHRRTNRDDWMGFVASANEVLGADKYKIRSLAGEIYNYPPAHIEDKPAKALVIHYKGTRKHWMVPSERRMLVRQDEARITRMLKSMRA